MYLKHNFLFNWSRISGSDIPGVKAPVLREALEQLRREDHLDMVLGRATDGGYYLVGLNTNAIPKMGK